MRKCAGNVTNYIKNRMKCVAPDSNFLEFFPEKMLLTANCWPPEGSQPTTLRLSD